MSALKRKSSLALIAGIIVILLLLPMWHPMLVPVIITSELEKIDTTTTFEGTVKGSLVASEYGVEELPIRIKAHAKVEEVKGDNIILKLEVTVTRTDLNVTLPKFSGSSTYVFNKFTRKNVPDAPEADKNRTGYDLLYPSHLKAGEDIPNVWLDLLNTTATLRFEESIVEEGVTLYKYSVNKTIIDPRYYLGPPIVGDYWNCTLIYAKTILIEPLSGLPVYTENETFILFMNAPGGPYPPTFPAFRVVYPLTYNSTAEAKAEGLATAKEAYDGMQLLELYIPTILGVVAIILTIGLAFNVRRLRRKMAPEAKT